MATRRPFRAVPGYSADDPLVVLADDLADRGQRLARIAVAEGDQPNPADGLQCGGDVRLVGWWDNWFHGVDLLLSRSVPRPRRCVG